MSIKMHVLLYGQAPEERHWQIYIRKCLTKQLRCLQAVYSKQRLLRIHLLPRKRGTPNQRTFTGVSPLSDTDYSQSCFLGQLSLKAIEGDEFGEVYSQG
jgi:hypothetical protein